MNFSPAIKGLITGALMLAAALGLYYTKQPADSPLQYIVYLVYGAGIAWTLVSYRRSPAYASKFGSLFSQGFRCFIVVTLIMVSFTGIFSKMHPEFAEEAAIAYKAELLEQKNKSDLTPDQIEEQAASFQKSYTVQMVSFAIFGYLVIGVIITAAIAAAILLTGRRE